MSCPLPRKISWKLSWRVHRLKTAVSTKLWANQLYPFKLTWKMCLSNDQLACRPGEWPYVAKTLSCDFLGHYKYDNDKLCMMIVLTELYWFISDLGCILRSQQCHSVVTETFCSYPITLKVCRIVIITTSRSWIYHYFWFPHMFNGENWRISWFERTSTVPFSCTLLQRALSSIVWLPCWGIYIFTVGSMTIKVNGVSEVEAWSDQK